MHPSKLKPYISEQDLCIVSHGGVGSNYISNFLYKQGIQTNCYLKEKILYPLTCHNPMMLHKRTNTPCLFIYGDYTNAILSMSKRQFLHINASKMHCDTIGSASGWPDRPLSQFINKFPNDPLGIKRIIRRFKDDPQTTCIKYPYTKEQIENTFKTIGINVETDTMVIKNRTSYDLNELELYVPDRYNIENIKYIIDIYKNFDDEIC